MKTIENGIKPGTEVPERQRHGNIGRWAEDQLRSNGYDINNGAGCDIPEMGIEVKTRKVESTSPHSIASMTIEDIIRTPYEDSIVCEKFQSQYRILYSDEGQVVLSDEVYNFSESYIQDRIREGYEGCRREISAIESGGYYPHYIKHGWVQVEIKYGSYQFRIPNGAMKKIEKIAETSDIFNNLFETVQES